jgi:hypothetical protein
MSKWKMESEQLRAAMRANRMMAAAQARGEDIRNIQFDTGPEVPDDRWVVVGGPVRSRAST